MSQARATAEPAPNTGTPASSSRTVSSGSSSTTSAASTPARSRSSRAGRPTTRIPPERLSVGTTKATRIGRGPYPGGRAPEATHYRGARARRRGHCRPRGGPAPRRHGAGAGRPRGRARPSARHRRDDAGPGGRGGESTAPDRRDRAQRPVARHVPPSLRAQARRQALLDRVPRQPLAQGPLGALMATVTVAIPVLNGARYLDEVLTAVDAQEVDRDVEVLVWDSGSTDGSLEIARRHGARIHEIPKREFSHGGTRNRMAAMARGEHVAFLTQDATPASPRWLAALLEGFALAEDVAAVFGPHIPRPDASHMIKCEMERHFATWGDGGRTVDVQRLDRSPAALAAYGDFPGRWTFLSDVNCAVAKWALQRVPYREVPYAEDQLLGRELIEAGYAKVYHPDAAVIHSHDYPPGEFLRRYFDEFRSLREVLDHVEPAGAWRNQRVLRGLLRADERWLRAHGVHGPALATALAVSARHHTIRQAGAILGSRADRLPPKVRGRLSLERRDSFVPA